MPIITGSDESAALAHRAKVTSEGTVLPQSLADPLSQLLTATDGFVTPEDWATRAYVH